MRDCTGGDDNTIGCCYSKHHHAIASTMVVRRLKRNFSWVASGLLALSLASILVSLTGLWSVEHGSSGRGDRLSRVLPTRTGSTHQKQDDANFYDSATHSKEKQKQAAAAVEARAAAYRQSQHQKGAPPPRPFPRWGDTAADEETHGLALPPVLDFILHSSAHAYSPKWRSPEQRGRNPEQYTRTTDHARDMNFWFPENLYVVDADGLWTSGLHRNVTRGGKGSVKDKLVPVEAMEALWRILLLRDDPDDGDDKWPRLRQLLVRNKDDKDDDNNSAVGFPYLGWFGDFTGCNYRNWKKEEDEQQQYYSIPLFTTAARVDCNYAFPFPNYQTIKDSQNTTQQWHQLMRQYAADYPWSAKRPQVVWRGSLTGEIYNATTKNARWRMVQKVTELRRDYEQQQQQNRQNHHHNQQQQQHPFLFDVGTTRLPRRHDRWELNLTEVGGILGNDQRISPKEDFQRYRGILDVDGNSWSARFGALSKESVTWSCATKKGNTFGCFLADDSLLFIV